MYSIHPLCCFPTLEIFIPNENLFFLKHNDKGSSTIVVSKSHIKLKVSIHYKLVFYTIMMK